MKHKHHIIPKHAGGTDDLDNIVELSTLDHAEAHRELYEKYGRIQDYYAWQGLLGNIDKEDIFLGLMQSEQIKEKISIGVKKYWDNLTETERDSRIEQFNSIKKGNQNAKGMTYSHTEESKNKIRNSRIGKSHITDEGKKRISEHRKLCVGRKHTPETIEKIRQSALNRNKKVVS